MLRTLVVLVGVAFAVVFAGGSSLAADYKETAVLLGKLKESKRSLAEGVRQAEQEASFATSAKFEMDGNELSLSVYTAREGKATDAEHNTLMELSGDPTKAAWTPKKEVFPDKEHIARASMHLTLMQLSALSLVNVIEKAGAHQPGMVYSANPSARNGRPVVDVLVATPDNRSVHLVVDLLNGAVSEAS